MYRQRQPPLPSRMSSKRGSLCSLRSLSECFLCLMKWRAHESVFTLFGDIDLITELNDICMYQYMSYTDRDYNYRTVQLRLLDPRVQRRRVGIEIDIDGRTVVDGVSYFLGAQFL